MSSFASHLRAAHRDMGKRRLSQRSAEKIVRAVSRRSNSSARPSLVVQLQTTKRSGDSYPDEPPPILPHAADWKQRVSMPIVMHPINPCGSSGGAPKSGNTKPISPFLFVILTKL